jgi:hypothetical protein
MHFTGYRETHVECTGERVYVCTGPIPGRFPSEPPGVLSGDVNSLFQGLGHVVLVDVAGDEAVLNQLLQSVEPLLNWSAHTRGERESNGIALCER